ncbi:MAG: hypothetical protein RLZZ488_2305 [Pseudomonadota bacterium]|jgi:hypothetical protein
MKIPSCKKIDLSTYLVDNPPKVARFVLDIYISVRFAP